jgi:hypothetical protein
MKVLALTSAKGAPGVSTAALAMTLLWPRAALLVEADPSGGSSVLAGYLRGTVEHSRGLLELALAHRHDQLAQTLWSQTIPLTASTNPSPARPAAHSDLPTGSATAAGSVGRWLLPGLSDAMQAPSLNSLWGPFSRLLADLEPAGIDVIIDAGRLGAAHYPTTLLQQADLVLLVLGSGLPAVAAARARIAALRADLSATGETAEVELAGVGLLLVGEGRPYTGREIAASLGLPVVAALAWDPASAEVLAAGAAPGRRFDASALMRSTRGAIAASTALMTHRAAAGHADPTHYAGGAVEAVDRGTLTDHPSGLLPTGATGDS